MEGAESTKDSGQDLLSGFEEQNELSRGCLRSRPDGSDVEGEEERGDPVLAWVLGGAERWGPFLRWEGGDFRSRQPLVPYGHQSEYSGTPGRVNK